jgi:integrase
MSLQRALAGPTVAAVLAHYTKARGKLRSIKAQEAAFQRHVLPHIGLVPIASLRRSQIAATLDACAEDAGPVMANRTLAYLRAALNWHALRTDDWQPPLVRGMGRAWPDCGPRLRVLDDGELGRIWQATGDGAPFSRLVRVLLLTGQRRTEMAGMRWAELAGSLWTLPPFRFKSGVPHMVPMTDAALTELPPRERGPFVFSTTGGLRPFSGYGKALARLHKASGTTGWALHDCRRTVRTRLAALGVADTVAELVLGHGRRGLARVYDQHKYLSEMRAALELWAGELARIVCVGELAPVDDRPIRA